MLRAEDIEYVQDLGLITQAGNGEIKISNRIYQEILLQAFLQRIINGGGQIDREYGLGRTRTDLFILWRLKDGSLQRVIIELKVLRRSREQTIIDGMAQTWKYADKCGADEAHLIIFDRAVGKPWEEKIFLENRVFEGTADYPARFPITIWGM